MDGFDLVRDLKPFKSTLKIRGLIDSLFESFTSSRFSNVSTGSNHISPSSASNLQVISLTKLSSNLEQLPSSPDCDYTDAKIIVEGVPVGVHRCILAERSKFFEELFKKDKKRSKIERPKYHLKEVVPYGAVVGQEAFVHFLSYVYTGRLKPYPLEVSTCVDSLCAHDSCRPAIDFVVRRLCNFVEKSLVENVIPILLVAFYCKLTQLLDQCIERVARSGLYRFCIEKEVPLEVAERIKQISLKSPQEEEENSPKLLLTESDITLDEANGLHYSVVYSDPKVIAEILMVADSPMCSLSMPEDLQMRLLYLEKRVGLARLFFPTEANVAMDIANVEGTREFTGPPPPSHGLTGNLSQVDLNETPHANQKTSYSYGGSNENRRYFPYGLEVLDKYMEEYIDDDILDDLHIEKGSPLERRLKRMRYRELKDDVQKAYRKDKESCLSASSSPSSSSLRDGLENSA
ncbi:unnamed protein product [Brassica napus]|uniref:(rape) hypothetical protein n=1 Tax=Brassica napus TaxID=3708 RepID=A0A816KAV1_BRANA|nr:unnamed protein product [Brassica napus]